MSIGRVFPVLALFVLGCLCVVRPVWCVVTPSAPDLSGYSGGVFPLAAIVTNPAVEYLVNPQYAGQNSLSSSHLIQAWTAYVQQINARGGAWINGLNYFVNLTVFNAGFGANANDLTKLVVVCDEVVTNNTHGYFPAILGPFSSSYLAGFGPIVDAGKRVFFAQVVSDTLLQCLDPQPADCRLNKKRPGARRWDYFFDVVPVASGMWAGALFQLKIKGAQTVAILDASDLASAYSGIGLSLSIPRQSMSVVFHAVLQSNESFTMAAISDALVQTLATNYPQVDAVFVNLFTDAEPGVIQFMRSCKKFNWLPKFLAFSPPSYSTQPIIDAIGGLDYQYTVSCEAFDFRRRTVVSPLSYPHDVYTSSLGPDGAPLNDATQRFFASMSAAINGTATADHAYGAVMITMLMRGLEMMNVNWTGGQTPGQPGTPDQLAFTDKLRQNIQGLYEPSFYSLLQFDNFGVLNNVFAVLQTTDKAGAFELIYPLDGATSDFVYPMPTFAERRYTPGYARLVPERVVLSLNVVCILLVVVIACLIWRYRQAASVKASSPIMLLLMLLGSVLMLSSIFLWTLYETSLSCTLHVWLFSVGYVLFVGPLFSKVYRLYRIFCGDDLVVKHWTDLKLLKFIIGPMVLFEGLYVMVWNLTAPFQARTFVVDPIRPMYNYEACDYNNTSIAFVYTSLTYKLVFLMCGCKYIYAARKVPSAFNETSYLSASVYNVFFAAIILVPIVVSNSVTRESTFVIRSIGVMCTIVFGVTIQCVPKLYQVLQDGGVPLELQDNRTRSPKNKYSGSTHSKDDMHMHANIHVQTTHKGPQHSTFAAQQLSKFTVQQIKQLYDEYTMRCVELCDYYTSRIAACEQRKNIIRNTVSITTSQRDQAVASPRAMAAAAAAAVPSPAQIQSNSPTNIYNNPQAVGHVIGPSRSSLHSPSTAASASTSGSHLAHHEMETASSSEMDILHHLRGQSLPPNTSVV